MNWPRKGRSTLWTSRRRLIDELTLATGGVRIQLQKTYDGGGWEDKESAKIDPLSSRWVEREGRSASGLGCYIGRVHS